MSRMRRSRGHDVLVVDDLSTGRIENVPAKARFEKLDIRSALKLTAIVGRFDPAVISHHAAQTSVLASAHDPVRDASVNVLGTICVMQAAVAHRVPHVVFASTGGAIYGEVFEGHRARETDPTFPTSPYGCSKLATESYLRFYALERGVTSNVLRYANVYGPRQDPHGEAGVVAIFANKIKSGQPVQINARQTRGDEGCIRDYVFIEDVVRANIAALEGDIAAPVINVCTGVPTSTKALAEALCPVHGITYGSRRLGDLERSVLDPTQFIALLGEPTSLEAGLQKYLKAVR